MSSLQIGRLLIGPPLSGFSEPLGDPVQGQGGAVVSAPRTPPQYAIPLGTVAADGNTDTLAARMTIRRQLRSLLNNTPLKDAGAFLYVLWSDDLEQDGWFIPDQASLTEIADGAGLPTGFWQLASANWYLTGRPRTHREARTIWMKDLRTGLYARDGLGLIYSTDFAALAALALSVLPNGAKACSDTVTAGVVAGAPLSTGRDGGQCQLVEGLTDMTVIAYERPEAALNLSDVIVYDRRGTLNAPTTGPGALWEEAYGPDHAWNWTTGGTADAPVLDNGLVRIRYDASSGDPGFRIDVWNGTAYSEQGKVTVQRIGDATGYCNTWVSAGVLEWTPERAVISVVLANSADAYSREQVLVTLQRGETQATFEAYPAPTSAGAAATVKLVYTPNGPDSNDSLMFEPATSTPTSGHDKIWSTAGGTAWTGASGTFSSSTANFLSILRCIGGASTVGPYQVNLAVVQQAATFAGISDTSAYGGSAQNAIAVTCASGAGYLQMQVGYAATVAKQVTGSGSWSTTQASQYRVFGLASSTWTDEGEYTGAAVATGSSTRVEAHLTQDRTRTGAVWNGNRDAGQAALYDARQLGAVVAR